MTFLLDLEVVQLLVEHGADFQAAQRGFNAITQAEDYGQIAVRDYLRSLGARTLRETTPPDYASAHQRFLQHLTRELGPLSDWQMEIPGEPLVTLRLIPAKKFDYQSLVTVGLSDHRCHAGHLIMLVRSSVVCSRPIGR